MPNKKVSIVTPTYNCVSKNSKTFFYEMFRSIHEQDYPNIEHIIVDGGSTDGSVEFINDLIKKYGKKEIIFISEKDRGINDATNKGYFKSSGEYVTLMNDDDFYTRPYAISVLVKTLENNNADFSCSDTWWLNRNCWCNDIDTFAYRHPFLINALLLKRELISEPPYYLDEKYPMVGDFDLFMRILSRDDIKGASCEDVLTVLRPGGYSSSNNVQHVNETKAIYKKFIGSPFFFDNELVKMHYGQSGFITYLKIMLFCKNKKIKESVKKMYSKHYIKKFYIKRLEYIFFFKFLINLIRFKVHNDFVDQRYSAAKARAWIETFYEDLYSCQKKDKIYVFDMDGTLTPARLPMTEEFKSKFLPWLKAHTAFIATGSDIKKVNEQLDDGIINEFDGIYCSMGNTLYKGNKLIYKNEIEYDEELLSDLENFRNNTKYPHQLFGNYIEKRIGMINFSVIGRDCTYEERNRYSAWDKENGERLAIQKFMSEKYPDYDFECGGNISIDIIPKGCGKGQIAEDLRKKYNSKEIVFVGDRTYPGGNDFALAKGLYSMANTKVLQVDKPEDVLEYLLKEDN